MNKMRSVFFNVFDPAYEIWLCWRFVRENVWTTILPLTFFAFGISVATHNSITDSVFYSLVSFTYFVLFIYVFDVNSQIFGVKEDEVNKPDRPLSSGLIDLNEGKKRAFIISSVFVVYAFILNVHIWAIFWFFLVWLYSYTGFSRNWLLKCLLVSLGTLTQLPAAATIVGVPLEKIWVWLVSVFVMMTICIGVQEFRDVEGDKKVGRETLPIKFGVRRSRYLIAGACVASILIEHFTIFYRSSNYPLEIPSIGFEALCSVILLWVAIRMLKNNTDRDHDDLSFRLFQYWYTILCASVIVYKF